MKNSTPARSEVCRGRVSIEFATLGGDAGFIGAAGLARIDHEKELAAAAERERAAAAE